MLSKSWKLHSRIIRKPWSSLRHSWSREMSTGTQLTFCFYTAKYSTHGVVKLIFRVRALTSMNTKNFLTDTSRVLSLLLLDPVNVIIDNINDYTYTLSLFWKIEIWIFLCFNFLLFIFSMSFSSHFWNFS